MMNSKIAQTAGELWLELDKYEAESAERLLRRLETKQRPRDLLLMALGWLVYQKHVKWIPGKNEVSLAVVSSKVPEGY